MSAFCAFGNRFISSALLRSNCVAHCTETQFPLLTFLHESCLILNKLLDFCFWLFFLNATWPWTSCFSLFELQFVLCVRRAGPVNLEVLESEKSMVVTLFAFARTPLFILLVFIAICRPCIFFFLMNWRSVASLFKQVYPVFPVVFACFIFLCQIFLILTIFQTFSLLFYLL